MTLKASYKVCLTRISIEDKAVRLPQLMLLLVKHQETNYINFQLPSKAPTLLSSNGDQELLNFLKLITKPEYVSLTFNTILYDCCNLKLFFQPLMLPNLVYEFEFADANILFPSLLEELVDSEQILDGFLTLQDVNRNGKKSQQQLADYERENCLSDSFEVSMIEG
jgi:hypothetical protein